MSLKRQTVNGIKWVVGVSFLQKLIAVATTAVLARLLTPSIFGLFALAFIAIDTLGLLKSMGFDSALIQRKNDIQKAANSAFFIISASGIFIYIILSFSAPIIAKFFNNSELVYVLRVLGFIFIINCLNRIPITLLEKNMQFAKVSIAELVNSVGFSIMAIILALQGYGIWSLVYGYIFRSIIQTILIWIFAKWRPRFEFDKKIAIEMFHFGKFLLLGSVVGYLKMNLDNILVGKLLGVTALGLYAIAFNIANFAADYFGGKIQRVTYPAFSKLQNNLYDLKSATLKLFKHLSLIALPLGIGIFLLGGEFLKIVFGEKWIGATGVLIILSWAGIFNTLNAAFGGIFWAIGKPKIGLLITTLQVSIFFIFIVPMAKLFGINGVGLVVSFSSFIAFLITLAWVKKLLSISLKQIYLGIKPGLISSLFMALGIILVKYILSPYKVSTLLQYNFLIVFSSAIVIYTFSLFKIERLLFKEIKEMIF